MTTRVPSETLVEAAERTSTSGRVVPLPRAAERPPITAVEVVRPVPVVTDAARATGTRATPVGPIMVTGIAPLITRPKPIEGQVAKLREPGVGVGLGRTRLLAVQVVAKVVPPPNPVGEAIGQGPIVDEVAAPPGPDHGAPLLGVPPVRATSLITPSAVEEPA